jgi:hypothetical protein
VLGVERGEGCGGAQQLRGRRGRGRTGGPARLPREHWSRVVELGHEGEHVPAEVAVVEARGERAAYPRGVEHAVGGVERARHGVRRGQRR